MAIANEPKKKYQKLMQHQINYQTQYRFKQFCQYPFDFVIFDNDNNLLYVVEYDGEQHFKPISAWGGEEQFKIQQWRDQNKNNYCQEHNFNLIRIPYTDFKLLSWDYLVNKMPKLTSIDGIIT